eukprot:TRINITY_DN1401_c0_g2_i1.p1 TRINITY_DN1401_c0_g2~~TRINITY_DN1401_c0_g2_i1.p1  ORF type:complete len:363 (-),score=71.45 TRINITY_DN1401_c0_g2_i1:16-1104(-)
MASVLLLGDERLRKISEDVTDINDPSFRSEIVLLSQTLEQFRTVHGFGRGISGPLIGLNKRVIVCNSSNYPSLIINPVITSASEEKITLWDDCMSTPWLMVKVVRSRSISISFIDEHGNKKQLENLDVAMSELLQHEIDHLNGILPIDRIQDPKTDIIAKQIYEKNRKEWDGKVDYSIQMTIPQSSNKQEEIMTISTEGNENKRPKTEEKKQVPKEFTVAPFVLVVVQRPSDNKFLAVLETRGRGWWLPAGHVEARETLETAAHRETLEEAGIKIQLEGVLKVQWNPKGRMRVVFFARPIDDTPLKSIPDKESERAEWISIEDLQKLSRKLQGLRGYDLLTWAKFLRDNGQIHPLSVIGPEV